MTSLAKIEALITAIGYYATIETGYGISFDEVLTRSAAGETHCLISYEGYKIQQYYEDSEDGYFTEPMTIYFKTKKTETLTQQNNLIDALSKVSFNDDFGNQHVVRCNDTTPLSDDTNHIWMQLSIDV